jgi:hypothetical protein
MIKEKIGISGEVGLSNIHALATVATAIALVAVYVFINNPSINASAIFAPAPSGNNLAYTAISGYSAPVSQNLNYISVTQVNRSSCKSVPCSYTDNSNFTFVFRTLDGGIYAWYFPSSTYGRYESAPNTVPLLLVNDAADSKLLYTYDYSGLVMPAFFSNVIGNLTNGRTPQQFVDEVFNFRKQLITYSLAFGNSSEYPPIIMADGKGDCKDLAILMASMLEAGNMQANYGMRIQLLYLDYPNVTDPSIINHIVINVIYRNGTSQLVETTGNVIDPYRSVNGWYFNLTCNSTSCNPLTACQNGDVLGADGICHAECGSSGSYCSSGSSCYSGRCITCQDGYVLGSDGVCHAECGNTSAYCGSGGTCYNGKCVYCGSGYTIGLDGICHQACGVGYCSSGSSCYNNQCISCPSGYHLNSSGDCYKD